MTTLRALFGSKKFITMLVGVAVALGARYGLLLDSELVAAIIGLFAITIGAQGLADQGKEAAKESATKNAAPLLAVFLLGAMAMTSQTGCGASARETTLRAAMTGLTIASDGFVAFDRAYQSEIVAKATNQAEGGATLAAYRARREMVLGAFAAAFHAIATAAVLNSDDKSLAAAVAAADLALQSWNELKGAIR